MQGYSNLFKNFIESRKLVVILKIAIFGLTVRIELAEMPQNTRGGHA